MRVLSLVLLIPLGPAPVLAQRVEYGLVDSIAGKPAGWIHRGNGDSVPVALLLPVYGGDSLAIAPGSRVRIKTHGGAPVWACGARAGRGDCLPSRVPAEPPRRGGGTVSAAFEALGRPLLDLFRRGRWERQVGAYIRGDGDPLSIPLLDALPWLSTGPRRLELVWRGGKAPYTVRLVELDRRREAGRLERLADSSAVFPSIELAPGEWMIELIDAERQVIQRTFKVAPAAEIPRPPASSLEGWNGTSRTIVIAVWLAEQDNGRWAWEAYQSLGTLAGTDETAARVRRELAAGRIP